MIPKFIVNNKKKIKQQYQNSTKTSKTDSRGVFGKQSNIYDSAFCEIRLNG